jgi:hypothetical protein
MVAAFHTVYIYIIYELLHVVVSLLLVRTHHFVLQFEKRHNMSRCNVMFLKELV